MPTRPNTAVAGALLAEPVGDITPATSYTVKSGDNLWTIARKNNITVAQLTAANSLSSNASLRPGEVDHSRQVDLGCDLGAAGHDPEFHGQGGGPVGCRGNGPARDRRDEACREIRRDPRRDCAQVRRAPEQLAVLNNISDPAKIRPGTELVIPGYQAPKSGKASKSGNGKAPQPSVPAVTEPPVTQPAPATPPRLY